MRKMSSALVAPAVLVALAVSAVPLAAEEAIRARSRVTAVTVYRQQALVEREARLALPPGDRRVVFDDLPAVADPDSIRVSGAGPAGLSIGGLEVSQVYLEPRLDPEYTRLQAELDDLSRRLALLDDRRKSIGALREFLGGLKAAAGTESSKDLLTRGFAVESWVKAFEFLSARLDALSKEERGLDVERRDLAQSIEVTRGALAQLASRTNIRRWSATVPVAGGGGEATLRLTYLVSGAGWNALYDARLDPSAGEVALAWRAQVVQTTGEDWNDVALTLATTLPAARIDLPRLATLHVTPADRRGDAKGAFDTLQVLGRNAEEKTTLIDGVSSDAPEAPPVPPARPAELVVAGAERREAAVVFAIPGRQRIPSDGQPHKHLIAARAIKAVIERHAVPVLVPAVFMAARLTLPGEIPILPGGMQHFVGPDLVGRSTMAARAAGEEFTLSFGADDRVGVERKEVVNRIERRGRDDEREVGYVTTLENHLREEAVVEVRDRIPVSGDERIAVTLDERETTPGFTTDPKEPGILTWKVTVPAAGKAEIALRYRIRAPRDLPLAVPEGE